MTLVPYLLFAAVALAAFTFIAVPLAQGSRGRTENREGTFPGRRSRGQVLLAAAIALFLLGVGGGTYLMLGQPKLALRQVQPVDKDDINALVALLIQRVHKTPNDAVAWGYLGRGYQEAKDPGDAAKAYARAIALMRAQGIKDASVYSAYGEAVLQESGSDIPPQAEQAFTEALAIDPKDMAARFFLGQAKAMHGDRAGAQALWGGLLADAPTGSPLHQMLVDRLALLASTGASSNGGAPDIGAMVAGLAARLKADPHDAAGWQRLIRAYAVLGDKDKAKDALETARKTFAGQAAVLAPINAEAQELKID